MPAVPGDVDCVSMTWHCMACHGRHRAGSKMMQPAASDLGLAQLRSQLFLLQAGLDGLNILRFSVQSCWDERKHLWMSCACSGLNPKIRKTMQNISKITRDPKRSQEAPHRLRHLLLHGLNPLTIFQAMLLKIQDLSRFDLRLG